MYVWLFQLAWGDTREISSGSGRMWNRFELKFQRDWYEGE